MATHDPTNGGARAIEPDPRDKGLGELVKDLASQTSTLVRQEIKLARAITHPNVVRVHDLGETDGKGFLTMEFVTGTTLRQLLARSGGRLDLQPGLQIAKQICRGLKAVHDAGIVRRREPVRHFERDPARAYRIHWAARDRVAQRLAAHVLGNDEQVIVQLLERVDGGDGRV